VAKYARERERERERELIQQQETERVSVLMFKERGRCADILELSYCLTAV
jgi:hypothetical protein